MIMKSNRQRQFNAQDAQPVEVFCRVKPLTESKKQSCISVLNDTTLQSVSGDNSRNGCQKEILHTFTQVFDSGTDQRSIFREIAFPLISGLLTGKNALLFAYGVTASGKTYTMQGDPQNPGILPRTLDVLFNSIDDLQSKKYVIKSDGINGYEVQSEADAMMERQRLEILTRTQTPRNDRFDGPSQYLHETTTLNETVDEKYAYAVFVSFVEIYNNYVFDLLQETTDASGPRTRVLRDDINRNVYVSGCNEMEVKSSEDAMKLFLKGQKRRRVGFTNLNAGSSRSHSVFTIRLIRCPYDKENEEIVQATKSSVDAAIKATVNRFSSTSSHTTDTEGDTPQDSIPDKKLLSVSQLCLVDLAGAERCHRTGNVGDRLREASSINTSLMGLRKCIEILRDNQKSDGSTLVPYRDNRLTHLFKNFFEGDGRVRMLICVNQETEEYDETINVLKFAENTQEVQTFKTPLHPSTTTPMSRRGHGAVPPSTPSQPYTTPLRGMSRAPSPATGACISHLNEDLSFISALNVSALFMQDVESFVQLENVLTASGSHLPQVMALMDQETSYFRSLLLSIDENSLGLHSEVRRLKEDYDSTRTRLHDVLEKNKSLETTLSELRQERADRVRQLDYYRNLASVVNSSSHQQTRGPPPKVGAVRSRVHQVQNGHTRMDIKSSTETDSLVDSDDRKPKLPPKPRPINTSTSERNLVSTLSKQWEGRSRQANNNAVAMHTPITRFHKTKPMSPLGPQVGSEKKGIPAMNPRHRRSQSTGDLWLDHQDAKMVPSGTLMTPMIKNRKSVTKLEIKDTTKATNYVLTHQQADDRGNLETHLYKGNIIPTAGGGASVIFSDIEALKQSSPPSGQRKRRSTLRNVENEAQHESPLNERELEDRCRMGIMGQPSKKRIRATPH